MRRPRWSLRRARVLVGTKFLLIAGLIGFVIVAWLVELVAGLHHPKVNLGPLLAALMAGIPAIFWLGFFYLMDRHEPEPKQLVLGVAVLGALIAGPLADFVQYQAVPPGALEAHGLSAFAFDRVLYAVMIAGLAQEMCKYRESFRYTIYMSSEVRRADGRHRLHDGVRHRLRGVGQLPPPQRSGPSSLSVDGRRAGGRHHARARVVRGCARLRDGTREVLATERAGARRVVDARPTRRGGAQRAIQHRRELGHAERHGDASVARRRVCGGVRGGGVRGDLVRVRAAAAQPTSPFKRGP